MPTSGMITKAGATAYAPSTIAPAASARNGTSSHQIHRGA